MSKWCLKEIIIDIPMKVIKEIHMILVNKLVKLDHMLKNNCMGRKLKKIIRFWRSFRKMLCKENRGIYVIIVWLIVWLKIVDCILLINKIKVFKNHVVWVEREDLTLFQLTDNLHLSIDTTINFLLIYKCLEMLLYNQEIFQI